MMAIFKTYYTLKNKTKTTYNISQKSDNNHHKKQ